MLGLFGSAYHGKTNRHASTGTCESCGETGQLASYDTKAYGVLFTVPVVSLGKKHIADECRSCGSHRTTKLSVWEREREEDIIGALGALRQNPRSAEAAARAIGVALEYFDLESLEVVDTLVGETATASVDRSLGLAYADLGRMEKSVEVLRRAKAREDSPETREALARTYLNLHRPVEAAALLRHIFEEPNERGCGIALQLVEAYQTQGLHDDALATLERIAATWPDVARGEEYARWKNISERHRESGKRIAAKTLTPGRATLEDEPDTSSAWSRVLGPALAIVFVSAYCWYAHHLGENRELHLINGTGVAYAVSVGGDERKLPPHSRTTIPVAEGDTEVRVVDSALDLPPVVCSISTSFFLRPIYNPIYIVNPDRSAIMIHERGVYTRAGDGETTWDLHVGQGFYSWPDVDCHFRELPETVYVRRRNSATRIRVDQLREERGHAIAILFQYNVEAAREYLRNALRIEPNDPELLTPLETTMPPDEAIAICDRVRPERPVYVHAHRTYQRLLDRHQPDVDLEAEYREILSEEPDDRALRYLAAMVTTHGESAKRLLRSALTGSDPCPEAAVEVAFRALCAGKNEAALSVVAKARTLGASGYRLDLVESAGRLATEQWEPLLDECRAERALRPLDADLAIREIDLLVRLGRSEAARAIPEAYVVAARNNGADASVNRWNRGYLASEVAYRSGDYEAAWGLVAGLEDAYIQFRAALSIGKVARASEQLLESGIEDFDDHVAVYLIASREKFDELGRRHLRVATRDLRARGGTFRQFAEWLEGNEAPALDEVVDAPLRPHFKRIVVAALGVRFPRAADGFFKLAAKLNFARGFPHHAVAAVAGEHRPVRVGELGN